MLSPLSGTDARVTESVLYHASEGVAAITLNRPEVLNAFSREMLESLGEAIERAAQDATVRAVVLTGAGRVFREVPIRAAGCLQVPAGNWVLHARAHEAYEGFALRSMLR
jgi:1,4-dihydroxy-2-naphthoyl-CoA synthase